MSTIKRLIVILAGCLPLMWAAAQPITPAAAFPLTADVPAEGNLNDANASDTYTFELPEGVAFTVDMEAMSGDLDPLLVLIDPAGGVVQNDDRAQGERDARVIIEQSQAGLYTLEATRFQRSGGDTSGTYRLTLSVQGDQTDDATTDPLTAPPPYSVGFTQLDYGTFGAGALSEQAPQAYFVVGGERGDLLRAILTITDNDDLIADLQIFTPDLTRISEIVRPRAGEVLAFTTLPERHWYLIEVRRVSGDGEFSLFVDGTPGRVVSYEAETPQTGTFIPNAPGASYVLNGRLDDQLFVSVSVTGGATPQIRLLDIRQREIEAATGERIALLQSTLPRTGTYIVQVNNTTPQATGNYTLRLSAVPSDPTKLTLLPASYNTAYKGDLTDESPRDIYTFDGKAGEFITVDMQATKGGLDPFLILMDADLNELVANDNSRGGANARINQFSLPADGTYYLLASRADLTFGQTTGSYTLALSAGAIDLLQGALSATVNWEGDDDLNLFIREPSGRIISWSNPTTLDPGALQVDSNTNCETISAQPVEHLYWNNLPRNGDYELWVWYQSVCGQAAPVDFTLTLDQSLGTNTELFAYKGTLQPNNRYELGIRVSVPDVFILSQGDITQPTPQQRASEGGDIPLLYGQTITGSIGNDVYARFYQFEGQQGETVQIDLETVTGNLDPLLFLRDNTETNVVPPTDDISDTNRDARLLTPLPYTGRYVIAVTRFGVRDGLTTGDYALTLRQVANN